MFKQDPGLRNIKALLPDDRPREKLMMKGPHALSNSELLSILIGSGIKGNSALEIAKSILDSVENSLCELGRLSIGDYSGFCGVGKVRASIIVAAMEIGRRSRESLVPDRVKLTDSRQVYRLLEPLLSSLNHEEFWLLLLNRSNKLIERLRVSKGGITGTVTDIRLILREALIKRAPSIIVSHNHPSGNIKPSAADLSITKKIKQSAEIMDIKLLDHLIIGEGDYFSFADDGLL